MGVNLPCKQGSGPKAGMGSGRGGGEIPRNRICIILLHIFTMIRFSLSSTVNYDPVFILHSGQETTKPVSSKMHLVFSDYYSAEVIEGLGVMCNSLAGEFLNHCLVKFCVLVFQVYVSVSVHQKATKTCHGVAGSFSCPSFSVLVSTIDGLLMSRSNFFKNSVPPKCLSM